MTINNHNIRADFPIFAAEEGTKPLVYLDNAATTQKPSRVITRIQQFYQNEYASVRRGIYPLAAQATRAYEQVRQQIQAFIGARQPSEIIFTKGTTESINLVATAFAEPRLQAGDAILISATEHHSNLLPWQQLCFKKNANLIILPINEYGEWKLNELPKLLHDRVRLIAISHISNTLGTNNNLQEVITPAHAHGIPVLVDGAQSIAHYPIAVQLLDCDFFVFSGHKMFAPSGVGILYAKAEHLAAMQPYQFGGEMIRSVEFDTTIFAEAPAKFEAGTPNIEGVLGLGAATEYIESIGKQHIINHLNNLLIYATEKLAAIPGLRIIGTAAQKTAIISFILAGIHPHDAATFLGEAGIAVRAGHHCTQPVMTFFGVPGTIRASFTIYNTLEEIDYLVEMILQMQRFFNKMG
ncbi:MAG: aminotransferase class V-fold PLP-dependent enzyme [Saprospiraceae bacterium]